MRNPVGLKAKRCKKFLELELHKDSYFLVLENVTETETRTTTAPFQEAGVQDVNTRLEQRAKQRMTQIANKTALTTSVREDRALECKDYV